MCNRNINLAKIACVYDAAQRTSELLWSKGSFKNLSLRSHLKQCHELHLNPCGDHNVQYLRLPTNLTRFVWGQIDWCLHCQMASLPPWDVWLKIHWVLGNQECKCIHSLSKYLLSICRMRHCARQAPKRYLLCLLHQMQCAISSKGNLLFLLHCFFCRLYQVTKQDAKLRCGQWACKASLPLPFTSLLVSLGVSPSSPAHTTTPGPLPVFPALWNLWLPPVTSTPHTYALSTGRALYFILFYFIV